MNFFGISHNFYVLIKIAESRIDKFGHFFEIVGRRTLKKGRRKAPASCSYISADAVSFSGQNALPV